MAVPPPSLTRGKVLEEALRSRILDVLHPGEKVSLSKSRPDNVAGHPSSPQRWSGALKPNHTPSGRAPAVRSDRRSSTREIVNMMTLSEQHGFSVRRDPLHHDSSSATHDARSQRPHSNNTHHKNKAAEHRA